MQDSLRQKEERIEELEEALRESVQITTEREVVLAQEEQARMQSEKQVTSPGFNLSSSPPVEENPPSPLNISLQLSPSFFFLKTS